VITSAEERGHAKVCLCFLSVRPPVCSAIKKLRTDFGAFSRMGLA